MAQNGPIGNAPAPNIHIGSLILDLASTSGRLEGAVSALGDSLRSLGVMVVFDAPAATGGSPKPGSALDDIYLSGRAVQANVDRLECMVRSLRESLAPPNVPTANATGYR